VKAKGFFSFYGVYLQIILTAAALVATAAPSLLSSWPTSFAILLVMCALPLPVYAIAALSGPLSKWLRLTAYSLIRIELYGAIAFVVLLIFTVLFLFNFIVRRSFMAEQIFLNVLLLNVLFLSFAGMLLGGKFRTNQPSELLIKIRDKPEIYRYQNGVIRHIPDPATFKLLGFSEDDIAIVSDKEFKAYTLRPAIESVADARMVTTQDSRRVWMIFGDTRRHIPDSVTRDFIQELRKRDIETVSKEKLQTWAEAEPLTSITKQK
jgi:hypothetical protein